MCMKVFLLLPILNLRSNHPITCSGKPISSKRQSHLERRERERERERETYHCIARTVFDDFTKLLDSVLYGPALHQAPPTLVVDITSDLSRDGR